MNHDEPVSLFAKLLFGDRATIKPARIELPPLTKTASTAPSLQPLAVASPLDGACAANDEAESP